MENTEILKLARKHRAVFLDEFIPYLHNNLHVFKVFCQLADQLWARRRKHYSSRTIVEKMRFDHDVSEDSTSTFKIANARSPDLGRLYALIHPERVDLFEYHRGNFSDYVKKNLGAG